MRPVNASSVAALLVALSGPAAAQTPAEEAAALLAQRLTGTELIIVEAEAGRELARGAILSPAIDTCRMTLMWTGGADVSVNLGGIRLLQGDGVGSVGVTEAGDDRPDMIFVVGADRYAAAMEAFGGLARICGSRITSPPPLSTPG